MEELSCEWLASESARAGAERPAVLAGIEWLPARQQLRFRNPWVWCNVLPAGRPQHLPAKTDRGVRPPCTEGVCLRRPLPSAADRGRVQYAQPRERHKRKYDGLYV